MIKKFLSFITTIMIFSSISVASFTSISAYELADNAPYQWTGMWQKGNPDIFTTTSSKGGLKAEDWNASFMMRISGFSLDGMINPTIEIEFEGNDTFQFATIDENGYYNDEIDYGNSGDSVLIPDACRQSEYVISTCADTGIITKISIYDDPNPSIRREAFESVTYYFTVISGGNTRVQFAIDDERSAFIYVKDSGDYSVKLEFSSSRASLSSLGHMETSGSVTLIVNKIIFNDKYVFKVNEELSNENGWLANVWSDSGKKNIIYVTDGAYIKGGYIFKLMIGTPPNPSAIQTSTGYRYPNKWKQAKKISIFGLKQRFKDKYNFAVPGLETTNVTGVACDTMVPQGICTTDEYILITAYDDIYDKIENGEKIGGYIQDLKEYKSKGNNKDKLEQEKNHIKHNSVIYVLDKKTRNYKTTLVLPDQNHVGGITFDGTYAWIAKSTNNQLSAISLDKINEKVKQNQDSVNISYDKTLNCGMKASYITYNKTDDTLWIGYNNLSKTNYLKEYKFNSSKNTLTSTNRKIDLPVYNTNGAVFAELFNSMYLIINSSPGRKKNSNSHIYKINNLNSGSIILKENDEANDLTLPPMAEEICIDRGKVYSIFESASTPYSTVSGHKCKYPTDRACVGNTYDFFGVCPVNTSKSKTLKTINTTTDEDGNTYEYDDNGNITYFEDTDGFWYRSEYDENGNEISCEYSDGYTYNNTYDENGNMLTSYCTSSDGTWVKASYTEGGNITSYEDSDEFWYKSEFDENENEIYYEDSDNYSYNQTYDEAGNLTYYKDNEGFWFEAEYDEDGNETYFENSEGYWSKKTYDENGEIVSSDEGNNDPTTNPTNTTNSSQNPNTNPSQDKTNNPNNDPTNSSQNPNNNPNQNINTFQTTKSPSTKFPKVTTKSNTKSTTIKKAKVKNLKVKAKGKKITVSWKKIKIAKGYQVQVATNKKFKKKKIVFDKFTKKKKLIITSSKIKRKKTYYVRVRAYAKGNGKKAYGKWSKKIRVKIK